MMRRASLGLSCVVFAAALHAPLMAADELSMVPPTSIVDSHRIDRLTAQALAALKDNELPQARALLRELVNDYPKYHLGQLLLAELHAANVALGSALSTAQYRRPLMQLLLEASAREKSKNALAVTEPSLEQAPNGLIKMGNHLNHWVQVDLENNTQTVYSIRGGKIHGQWQQYIGYGAGGFDKRSEGDLKTPLGVYRIHGYRSDNSLPELYGSGALMLDYPNAADRFENRTGSGIWLHGVPRRSRSRGPHSSEGCVTMGNDYLTALHALIDPSSTLVALSAASHQTRTNIDLATLQIEFHRWRSSEQARANSAVAELSWDDVTVAVSGAGAIDGEPQQLTFYFSLNEKQHALFWQRTQPNANSWTLIADEVLKAET